jgi:hypothetical protein
MAAVGFARTLLYAATSFAPPTTYPEVKYLHVINSCHLDIGFADSSAGSTPPAPPPTHHQSACPQHDCSRTA